MNNLFERVVLGHESPNHFRQRYGGPVQAVGKGCQQPLGLLEPLLSSSVVGQTQEIGRRHRVSAGLSSVLIWVTHTERYTTFLQGFNSLYTFIPLGTALWRHVCVTVGLSSVRLHTLLGAFLKWSLPDFIDLLRLCWFCRFFLDFHASPIGKQAT